MKFVVNNKLIVIYGEEYLLIRHLSSFRYIEANEDALETSFQSLEIFNSTFMEEKDHKERTSSSFASLKSEKSTMESGGLKVRSTYQH